MASWLLHMLLPSSVWGWLGYTSLIALGAGALFLSLTGGTKVVGAVADVAEAAIEPIAKEAGTLIAEGADLGFTKLGAGITGIAANPVVLWPMVVLSTIGIWYAVQHYRRTDAVAIVAAKHEAKTAKAATTAATIAQKAAATRLAQCLAAKPTTAPTRPAVKQAAPTASPYFTFPNIFTN